MLIYTQNNYYSTHIAYKVMNHNDDVLLVECLLALLTALKKE
jgi:hypothetical protein